MTISWIIFYIVKLELQAFSWPQRTLGETQKLKCTNSCHKKTSSKRWNGFKKPSSFTCVLNVYEIPSKSTIETWVSMFLPLSSHSTEIVEIIIFLDFWLKYCFMKLSLISVMLSIYFCCLNSVWYSWSSPVNNIHYGHFNENLKLRIYALSPLRIRQILLSTPQNVYFVNPARWHQLMENWRILVMNFYSIYLIISFRHAVKNWYSR